MDSIIEIGIFNWLTVHLKISVPEADEFIRLLKGESRKDMINTITEKAERYHSEECMDYLDCPKCSRFFKKLE